MINTFNIFRYLVEVDEMLIMMNETKSVILEVHDEVGARGLVSVCTRFSVFHTNVIIQIRKQISTEDENARHLWLAFM